MNYLIFARKFRPQTFDQVVGQETVVTTLQNAIKQNRVSQNFIFSGPRGVGKTSVARILAMALNAQKDPSINFDPKSDACQEIIEGRSMDVLEIDGASNRGIDEIRNLRETVKFKPVSGRYKIYIIDEVHMLTTEAFNALLKTLEEPPPHVKFIFATTEAHKVPLTILSRCQRFTFRRLSTSEIATKLEEIAKAEKLKFQKNAIFQIAKASDGALRDGEGLLDQLASFSEGTIKEEDVLMALGLAPEEVYFSVLDALKTKDAQSIFSIIENLYDDGKDLVQFAKGLLEIFRNLLLLQCSEKGGAFIELSEESMELLKKAKGKYSKGESLLALSILGNLQGQLRRNLAPPRLLVEIALLKLLHLDGLESLSSLLAGQAPNTNRGGGTTSSPVQAPVSRATAPRANSQVPPRSVSTSSAKMAPALPGGDVNDFSIDVALSVWSRTIDYVKTKRMSIGIFLSEASPVEVSGGVITLGLPSEFQFHKEMLEKEDNRKLVEESFQVVLGFQVRAQFVITKAESSTPKVTVAPAVAQDTSDLPDIITQAMDIFDGASIVKKD